MSHSEPLESDVLHYRLRDLLVLQALEVAMLLRAVGHCAALWLHPALGHKVQLRVQVHGLHFGVVVIIGGEARVPSVGEGEHLSSGASSSLRLPGCVCASRSQVSNTGPMCHYIVITNTR